MKNPSMIHRAENMWIMFAPYRTQKEGQMRALMEQMQKLTK